MITVVWDEKGRELVCTPVNEDHPLIENYRAGYFCKVFFTKDSNRVTHVYFENATFTGPCYFYHKKRWWQSFVALTGWMVSFTPPRKAILEQELSTLAERIIEINKELDTLR